MSRHLGNSFRLQVLLGVFGAFIILGLSTMYILYSTHKLQELADRGLERERFLTSLQQALEDYQAPLLEYLSTRSSNALARLLIESQRLRSLVPANTPVPRDRTALKEREVQALILAYLELADLAIEEKRGRNIAGYTALYDEMDGLLRLINAGIEAVGIQRFRDRLEAYGEFLATSGAVRFWNLLFIASVALFATLLLLSSAERVTAPMTRLSAMATAISAGNFAVADIRRSSIHEIDQVVAAFNSMKAQIQGHIDDIRRQETIKQEYMQERLRNLKMQALLRRMEIYTLQAQMNPHFLFNTLNTGMQLAIVEGADRTGEYMERLSMLFRHNIRSKDTMVALRHEIEGLEHFFYILKVRFPRSLDLTLDCPGELLDSFRVPVSILQPLVENCVVHAFRDRVEGGAIIVRAERLERRLMLSVGDNGRGMAPETVATLLRPLPLEAASSRVMGLENVIQRLYFFYPGSSG